MKPTRNSIELRLVRPVTRALWPAQVVALAVGVVVLVLLAPGGEVAAQETTNLIPTNSLAPTNRGEAPPKVENAAAMAPTNGLVRTNELLQTNVLAQTNGLLQTNQLVQTNSLVETKLTASGRDSSPTNVSAPILASSNRMEYAWFRLIPERNIFNPNRYPNRRYDRPTRDFGPRVSSDSFWLIGTMSYEKGYYAFFDGSRYDFRKTVKPDETIAGYRVNEVGYNYVKLASRTNELELRMGMRMRREGDGDWMLVGGIEPPTSSSSALTTLVSTNAATNLETTALGASSTSTNATTNATAAASSSGAESDILKKLMQRREQELNK